MSYKNIQLRLINSYKKDTTVKEVKKHVWGFDPKGILVKKSKDRAYGQ